MNKRDLQILRIGFEAGKKAIETHPDDDEYDAIRLEEAQEQVKDLDPSNTAQQRELLILAFGWAGSIGEQFFDDSKTVEDMVEVFLSKLNCI